MPFIPAPNIVETFVRQELFGEEVGNVLHWDVSSLSSEGRVELVAETLAGLLVEHVVPSMCNVWRLLSVKARDLTTDDAAIFEYSGSLPATGARNVASAPGNVALVLTKRTAFAGRTRRGRLYIPGVEPDATDSNLAAGAWAAAITSAWLNVFADMVTDIDAVPVVLSKFTGGLPRSAAVATSVTSLQKRNNRVDTQRRRLPED